MDKKMPYATILARHPEAVAAIVAQLRKSKSMHRGLAPDKLVWGYNWCIQIDGSRPVGQMPEDQELADHIRRVGCGIKASKGHWWGFERLPEGQVPVEVVELYRNIVHNRRVEQAAYEALPAADKERQFQEALATLTKDPGFRIFGIEVKGNA